LGILKHGHGSSASGGGADFRPAGKLAENLPVDVQQIRIIIQQQYLVACFHF
jgi:hypothetical protein